MENFVNLIKSFFSEYENFIMPTVTMLVGIVAGWFPTFKKACQRKYTIIAAIVFDVIVGLCYQSWCIFAIAIVFSVIWCLLSLIVFNREEISRKKICKLIIDFTENADKDQPICIFGGDVNFFGDYIPPRIKLSKTFSKNDDIATNEQFTQILNKGFREIKILAVKPYSDTDSDVATRIRIGYIINKLGEKVQIKFYSNDICKNCENFYDCIACNCDNCMHEGVCDKSNKDCEKLKKYCQYFCYNPETTLRGRIVTNKDTHSKCVAIATTKDAGKKYILREYSAVAKECQLYQVIWEVWWSKCEYDNAFLDQCMQEYEEYKDENK